MRKRYKKCASTILAICLSLICVSCGSNNDFTKDYDDNNKVSSNESISEPVEVISEPVFDEEEFIAQKILTSVSNIQEVALLNLAIQGIQDTTSDKTVWGVKIPGSDKTQFIKYSFTAKLGIDGSKVSIDRINNKHFSITIPEFIFIGYSEPKFELSKEKNGVLSWLAPSVDQLEAVNDILNDEKQKEYLEEYMDDLEKQASSYFSSIIKTIENSIEIEFIFR